MSTQSIQKLSRCTIHFLALGCGLFAACGLWAQQPPADESAEPISYYQEIRPIFQQHCFGCHQGAKQDGQYVMTQFSSLLAGGESGLTAIVPGQPENSYLMEMIQVVDGNAEMPLDAAPLDESNIERIRQWIEAGAVDDTPEHASVKFNRDHPPQYQSLPTVTSLDVSPDQRWLAVAGYHEVLLHDLQTLPTATSSGAESADAQSTASDEPSARLPDIRRLVGLSERIESVVFSPDGKKLAVTGGSPGRLGEVQIWDVESASLLLSQRVGADTLYGASWSHDGRLVAFGCPDSTVRAMNSETGEEVLFNGAHNDWVLDTTFSTADDHLITVSRDMSMKLIKVDTQRFVDNITSITPGALKGGLNAVDCHPQQDVLLAAGADGTPRIYRMLREKARKIGDDFNLIRAFPALPGRVFDAVFSPQGDRIAAVSSINGRGHLQICETETGKQLADFNLSSGGLFAVSFYRDNSHVVFAGFDGRIRILDVESNTLVAEFDSVPRSR